MNFLKVAIIVLNILFGLNAFAAPKRVLILYSTGGHSTAAKSVEELLKQYPEEFEVIRHDFAQELDGFAKWFYFEGYDFISQKANWINKAGVKFKWWQSEHFALFASQRFNAKFNQPKNILNYLLKVQPDVIISTHFSLADTLATLREQGHLKNVPIAWTHLDVVDNVFFRQIGDQLDMSFLPTAEMKHEWAKSIPPNKLKAVGIPIMPSLLQSESISSNETDTLNDVKLNTKVVLIGGSMGALSYDKIIKEISAEYLSKSNEIIEVTAVCGRNEKKALALKKWSESNSFPRNISLNVTGFIDQKIMRSLIKEAHLVISKPGGLTTFELLTTGKPVIMTEGIGIQEKYNAQYVEREGAAIFLETTKGIGKAAYSVLSGPDTLRNSLVEKQKKLTRNFKLNDIIEWTRTAEVLQPERPSHPILQREKSKSNHILKCQSLFI